MKLSNVNWKAPKYALPAILYPLLLGCGYLVIDMFYTKPIEAPSSLESTEYLNPTLPKTDRKSTRLNSSH